MDYLSFKSAIGSNPSCSTQLHQVRHFFGTKHNLVGIFDISERVRSKSIRASTSRSCFKKDNRFTLHQHLPGTREDIPSQICASHPGIANKMPKQTEPKPQTESIDRRCASRHHESLAYDLRIQRFIELAPMPSETNWQLVLDNESAKWQRLNNCPFVRRNQNGDAQLLELGEHPHHSCRQLWIKVSCWLIGNQAEQDDARWLSRFQHVVAGHLRVHAWTRMPLDLKGPPETTLHSLVLEFLIR